MAVLDPMPTSAACPVCGAAGYAEFYRVKRIPVQDGLLWATKTKAVAAPTGSIRLCFCSRCGCIGNAAFDGSLLRYVEAYDISLHHSPAYRRFIDELAARLTERYQLNGRTVLEIGCGKGDFLRAICRASGATGTGFDPTYVGSGVEDGFTVVRDLYDERHADIGAHLLVCRHVLESLPDPRRFLELLRRTLGDRLDTIVYLEVPRAERIIGDAVAWNVTYESCWYFGVAALRSLCGLSGFAPLSIAPCFEDEYLAIEARPTLTADSPSWAEEHELRELADAARRFGARCRAEIDGWAARLAALERRGSRVAAWGAGGRAITFFTTLGVTDLVPIVADINPQRQGSYLPATGQLVVSPDELQSYRPDVVIITNPAFEREIRAHAAALGLTPVFLVLRGGSPERGQPDAP